MNKPVYHPQNWLEFLRKSDEDLLKLCRVDIFKATGRGGQKKNKTANAVRLTLSHLTVYESKSRSKGENLKKALRKMRLAIAGDDHDFLKNRNRLPVTPVEIAPYLNKGEIRINPKNVHFPIVVGYLMNSFIRNKGSWQKVGLDFGTSTTQIRRFAEKNPDLYRLIHQLQEKMMKTKADPPLPSDVSAF